jgi:hypothetical protein
MTSLCGIAADVGNSSTRLEVELPLEVALALGLALGVVDGPAPVVGDLPAGLTWSLGEAVVLPASPLPDIRNPTPTATPANTRTPAMIESHLSRGPPDPS